MHNHFINEGGTGGMIHKVRCTRHCLYLLYIVHQGMPFETAVNKYHQPPTVKDMGELQDQNSIFMIRVSLIIMKLIIYYRNSHLNMIHLVRSMMAMITLIDGMKIMFACHAHNPIYL
jgi:hypothetical protein